MRTSSVIAGCVLLGLMLANCGSKPKATAPEVDPESALAAATQRTLGEETALIVASESGGRAQGEVSFAKREARISFESGERYIYTANDWYISQPHKDPFTGKKWLHYERGDGLNFDDRLRFVVYLAAGASPLGEGDSDEIDGVRTTHYETTVAVEAAVEAAPKADWKLVKNALEEQLLGRSGDVEFWIDGDGRVRRIRIQIPPGRKYSRTNPDGSSVSYSSETTMTNTIYFSNFGVDVDATPPPDDQVGDYLKP